MSERRLVRSIRSGDGDRIRRAFSEIYARYSRLVYFVISGYVHNVHDVEELVSDVFAAYLDTMLGGGEITNIKYYLTTSARNVAINHLSRAGKRAYAELRENVRAAVDVSEAIISTYAYGEIVGELRRFLSEDELGVVIARSVYGESFADIAKSRNVSQNTVISRYHRAIKKIRKRGIRSL
jgi:RNA polymerase sigma-70 factor (ECF subfamily)